MFSLWNHCLVLSYLYFIIVDCLAIAAIAVLVSFSYLPRSLNFCLELVFACVVVLTNFFSSIK